VPWQGPKTPHGAYGSPENQNIVKAKAAASKAAASKQPTKKTQGKVRNYGPPVEAAEVPDNTFHDGALADLAVATLAECVKKDQPFWLGVGFIRPHLPFVAPKKYWDLYDPAKIELAPNPYPPKGAPSYALTNGGELRSYHGVPQGPIPEDMQRQLKHGYYAAISYMDAQVGRLLDEIDRLGVAEKTVIVLWGDHGWKLGEHGSWCKHSNVENDTNAPLLISVPGLKTAGKSTAALAEFVDIYPTLAEACGLPLPGHLQGTSLLSVLQDTSKSVKAAALSQYPRAERGQQLMGYSMRTDRYRFTRWLDRNDHTKLVSVELYDHQTDPQENVNIAGDANNSALVANLTEQWFDAWKEKPASK
jgi:arylsulfatase A-like enzyme